MRFHDLRHTVATLMLQGEINPKVVKEILGHSDVRITLDIYSHVLPRVHKETAQNTATCYSVKLIAHNNRAFARMTITFMRTKPFFFVWKCEHR
ncbi:tyrosine-type recombinase/integrase [Paenibacillus lactis]|uniref:tyrosine-type recombinase/integrase n=1 Tax=Paenibacillus lactis TaxID=228574 RepID=UPI0027959818|nr:tyrosine-type recombinase/integrase [Paenibacillus lactis]